MFDQRVNSPPNDTLSTEHPDAQVQPLTQRMDNLIINPLGNPQYLGNSSSTALGRRVRDLFGVNASTGRGLSIDMEIATYNPQSLRSKHNVSGRGANLPPYNIAKRYFAAQYTMIGTIFAFVLPEVFEYQLQQAYIGPPNPDDPAACLEYCEVLLILAFGQMYAINQYTDAEGPPGFNFFSQVLQHLPGIHEEPSVKFCGVLALVGYFMQNLNRRDVAFLYVGLAQRMAISLALHEEVPMLGLDDVAREQRRRTWWSIYSLDRILCVKYGNPVTINDKDILVALPVQLPGEPDYCPAVVLRHYTMLSKILGQIMINIYRNTSKLLSELLSKVQEIMGALTQWERQIPDLLRYDPGRMDISRESMSTFLHYYQCINMTARPLLFHLIEQQLKRSPSERLDDWRESLSQPVVSVVETCILAARETVSMMETAQKKNLVAVFGYMDGEHAFSAAIVLVMVCVAFPHNNDNDTAMDAALLVLERMACQGNPHIEVRHKLLVQLRSVIDRPPSSVDSGRIVNRDAYWHRSVSTVLPDMENLFASDLPAEDWNMFEAAYLGTDLSIDNGLNQWIETATSQSLLSSLQNEQ